MADATRPAEDINLNRKSQLKSLSIPDLESRLAETQKKISQRLAGSEKAEIGLTAGQLGLEGQGRGIATPLIRGQQEKLGRQRAIERQTEAVELAPLQRQEAALLGRLGREETREATKFQQEQQLAAGERAERGLQFQLEAPQRTVETERRAEERGIRTEERGATRTQQQFEQNLALQGFSKVASPDQLKGLTEDQIQRVPNPITGQVDIFRKPEDDELLSVSEATDLGVDFGTTVKQAKAMGITPIKKSSGGKGTTNLQRTDFDQLSSFAKNVFDNPELLNELTPTKRGEVLDELSSAGADLTRFTVQDLSASQREKISQFDDLSRQANEANILLKEVGIDLGPLAGRIGKGAALFGGAKDFTRFRSIIDNMNSSLLKLRSGAAVTPEEFKRISGFIPDILEDEETAKTKIKSFVEEMQKARENFIKRATQTSFDIQQEIQQKPAEENIVERDGMQFRQNDDGSITRIK